MNEGLQKKAVCPLCKKKLDFQSGGMVCKGCHQTYPLINGIPNFLTENLMAKYNSGPKDQDLDEEQSFYQNMYKDMKGLDDGHCVVYGYDSIYNYMGKVPTGDLLDVGCGAGHHSKDLAMKGYNVVGIDIALNGLVQAEKICAANNLSIDFVLGDIENLPFDDNSFDTVFCSLILHHFPKRKNLLRELARVSKKYFVAFEVNAYDVISFIRFDIINPTLGIRSITKNQRTVSPTKLERELIGLGYNEIRVEYVDIHESIGKYPTSLKAKLFRGYNVIMHLMPFRFRFNKFILIGQK